METGKNQSYNRSKNNHLVLNYLRDHGMASATTLAAALNLSNAALSSILKNLVEKGFIKESAKHSVAGKGRKQVDYTLNDRSCLMALINIQLGGYHIELANIKEEILVDENFEADHYDEKTFESMMNELDRLTHLKEYEGIPLKLIIVSAPGKVDVKEQVIHSFVLTHPIYEGRGWLETIEKRFPTSEVMVGNILSFAMHGEVQYGAAKDKGAAILISNESTIWGSIAVDKRVFVGEDGYAGDFGAIPVMFNGNCQPLASFASVEGLKKHFGFDSFDELVKAYQEKEEVKSYVLSTAIVSGLLYYSAARLLNITSVILTGNAVKFGDEYLSTIRKAFENADFKTNVIVSKLNKDSISLGAFYVGAIRLLNEESEIE